MNDPSLPPTPENIAKIYEMKFPGDDWKNDQREAYQRIAESGNDGAGAEVEELNAGNCACNDGGQTEGVLAAASAYQLAIDNARSAAVNQATLAAAATALLGGVGRAAVGTLEGAAGYFGRLLGAVAH